MRSRNTNILQTVILITGLVYIILGIALYASTLTIIKAYAGNSAENISENISGGVTGNTAGNINDNLSENWLDLSDNEIIGPLIYTEMSGAVLFTTGLRRSCLFSIVEIRSLIYFQGILFPIMSAALLIKQTVSPDQAERAEASPKRRRSSLPYDHNHTGPQYSRSSSC
jgi:hypothetical protein